MRVRVATIGLVSLTLVCLSLASAQWSAATGPLTFKASALDAGGVENALAIDPVNGVLLAGGNVSGIHRSTDWGQTWQPANRGIQVIGINDQGVASLAFAPTNSSFPGRAFAAVGASSKTGGFPGFFTSGGVYVSDDHGQSWTLGPSGCTTGIPDSPHFNGPDWQGGNLFAFGKTPSGTGDLVFAGSYPQGYPNGPDPGGLTVSGDGGCTWSSIKDGAGHMWQITSIALTEAVDGLGVVHDTVYVATWANGIFKVTDANSQAHSVTPMQPIPAAQSVGGIQATLNPTPVEELAIVNNAGGQPVLYAAAGTSGVFSINLADSTSTWTDMQPPLDHESQPAPLYFRSIAGYRDSVAGTVILAGAWRDKNAPNGAGQSVLRWDEATPTWRSVVAPGGSNVFAREGGPNPSYPNPRDWWRCDISTSTPDGCLGAYAMGGAFFGANDIVLDVANGSVRHAFVSGDVAVWGFDAAWGSAPFDRWHPMVRGLNSMVMHAAAAVSGCAFAGASDFAELASSDGFDANVRIGTAVGGQGRSLAVDATTSKVYAGAGDNGGGTSSGDVYVNSFDATNGNCLSGAWTSTRLANFTSVNSGKRPLAVAVGRPGGQSAPVLLATTSCPTPTNTTTQPCGGVWRIDNS